MMMVSMLRRRRRRRKWKLFAPEEGAGGPRPRWHEEAEVVAVVVVSMTKGSELISIERKN